MRRSVPASPITALLSKVSLKTKYALVLIFEQVGSGIQLESAEVVTRPLLKLLRLSPGSSTNCWGCHLSWPAPDLDHDLIMTNNRTLIENPSPPPSATRLPGENNWQVRICFEFIQELSRWFSIYQTSSKTLIYIGLARVCLCSVYIPSQVRHGCTNKFWNYKVVELLMSELFISYKKKCEIYFRFNNSRWNEWKIWLLHCHLSIFSVQNPQKSRTFYQSPITIWWI